jgi:phenylacetate-CoA ligase
MLKEALLGLYGRLPVPLQNASISAWGVYSRRQRYGGRFPGALAELQRSEWWSADQIEAWQTERLREVVTRALDRVPYYREVFGRHGVRPSDLRSLDDLSALPMLTKPMARERSADLLDPSVPSQGLRLVRTSGTTGSALVVRLTPAAQQFFWAVAWRHRGRFGLALGDPFLTFGARLPIPDPDPAPPLWRFNHAIRQAYLSAHHLTNKTMPAVVEWLQEQRFAFFAGYPSAMYVLASYMDERGITLRTPPRWIVTGSESLLPHQRPVLERAFGARTTELYGMGECSGGYSRCPAGRLHLDFELGVVELLEQPPGLASDPDLRRIVVTGLQNPAMPFIRYETGDLARVARGACTCGRASPTVEAIDGRIEDYIATPDGRQVVGINQVFKWAPHLREAQVVQDRVDAIEVHFVPAPGFTEGELGILRDELTRRLGAAVAIHFRPVEAIPRTANGKVRAVVSRLPPP